MDKNLLKGNLDLILLSILEPGERYGLEVAKEANERTDGLFEFSIGSLYPALHRLEQAGHLESDQRPSPRGGTLVKYYRLTDKGRKELARRKVEFERFTGAVRSLWNG